MHYLQAGEGATGFLVGFDLAERRLVGSEFRRYMLRQCREKHKRLVISSSMGRSTVTRLDGSMMNLVNSSYFRLSMLMLGCLLSSEI